MSRAIDAAHAFNIARSAVVLDGRRFGTMECPVCAALDRDAETRHGRLAFSVSTTGRVYARCSWPGCVVVQS